MSQRFGVPQAAPSYTGPAGLPSQRSAFRFANRTGRFDWAALSDLNVDDIVRNVRRASAAADACRATFRSCKVLWTRSRGRT